MVLKLTYAGACLSPGRELCRVANEDQLPTPLPGGTEQQLQAPLQIALGPWFLQKPECEPAKMAVLRIAYLMIPLRVCNAHH